ncbi:response regulator [Acaryochloris sp. CCMEE 5410]|nr:response regulator [Acaryochloris sp. CCMEE 5410]
MNIVPDPNAHSVATGLPAQLILIVDDSETDRFTYCRSLGSVGKIEEYDCGEAALVACHSQVPDLILLDYNLPDMNGLELMAELTAQLKICPPVIMLTGQGSEEVAVAAMKAGAKDYLIKGQLTPANLLQTVGNVLTEHRLRTALEQYQQQRSLLTEVALQINRASELDQILQVITAGTRQLLGCDRTLIYQFEINMSGIVVAESVLPTWTSVMGLTLEDNCFQGEQSYQAHKYIQGHRMVVADITTAGLSDCHLRMLQQFQVKANLVVPIISHSVTTDEPKLWGLLIAHHCQTAHDWQPEELTLMDELAVQGAIAIQQAELVTSLRAGLKKQQAIDRQLQERATELGRANRKLAQALHRLNQRNQELDEFAYIVSHDLKAPLRGISNLSQWLVEDLQEQLPQENQEQLRLIQHRVLRMEELINGVLQYSRAGKQTVEILQVDILQLLHEVVDSLTPPAEFQVVLPDAVPQIETQPLLLKQVFANLISNAIKYHDRPDGCIQIRCQDLGEQLQFTVADDGPGIAPENHQRIFGIFQTLAPADHAKGTGLGLTIIKKIVEQQGGTVWVESDDRGSAFFFTWPRRLA